MLRSRVVPCLLLRDSGLVKTVQFANEKYIGDPQNAIKIFNEKEVDELCLFDIDATKQGRTPDLSLIEKIANQCRMPLTYGGGINTPTMAEQVIRLGVEKVALGQAAATDPDLIRRTADAVGSQSVAVVLDVKKKRLGRSGYEIRTHNKHKGDKSPNEAALAATQLGAGEIIVNCIDEDGMMTGYDLELARSIRSSISTPMTVVGGAGSLDDVAALIAEIGPVGAGVGSLFVFKGSYKAVLISYQRPGVS